MAIGKKDPLEEQEDMLMNRHNIRCAAASEFTNVCRHILCNE